jgi:hypothetical protein
MKGLQNRIMVLLKQVIIRSLLLSMGISFGTACSKAQNFHFETETHDFGTIKQNEKISYTFKFINGGQDTVMLQQPKPGCGCTAALLSNSVVAPGDSGSVFVEYNAYPGVSGRISKTVQIYRFINKENQLISTLRIEGEVVAEIAAEPKILQFETTIGTTVKNVIKLTSMSKTEISLGSISASFLAYIDTTAGNQYHAETVTAKPFTDFKMHVTDTLLLPEKSTELLLELTPDKKGQINGSIRIVLPKSELRIPVVGVIVRTK